jgi:hypothetical protein
MIGSGVPRGADGLVAQQRLVVRLAQAIGPLRRGPERDAVAGLTSWDPQCDCKVRLSPPHA